MLRLSQIPRLHAIALVCRRLLRYAILAICAVVLVHALILEPFQIPTGSMAPTLNGHHRACICPRCGQEVLVGRSASEREGARSPTSYRKASCPNCGLQPLAVQQAREVPGDQILVNKLGYYLRAPERWEIVVFRLFGTFYIKRLLGLPGEEILIHDGDLYANGQLIRKTLEQARAMRILLCDQEHAPTGAGWQRRWEIQPSPAEEPAGSALTIDGRTTPAMLRYRHVSLDTGKCEAIRDEYAYNAGLHADSECVHDFSIETEVETSAHQGTLALRLCDGHDWVEVDLPVGEARSAEVFAWPIDWPEAMRKLGETEQAAFLTPGRRHRVELAFVDRRLSLAVDGRDWFGVDLPEARKRTGVAGPFEARADGVRAVLHRFRLHRDLHYGQQGRQGVRGKSVCLGVDQYFVLGDNSPNSEDSRFWPDQGRIPANALVGAVWLIHGPGRWRFP